MRLEFPDHFLLELVHPGPGVVFPKIVDPFTDGQEPVLLPGLAEFLELGLGRDLVVPTHPVRQALDAGMPVTNVLEAYQGLALAALVQIEEPQGIPLLRIGLAGGQFQAVLDPFGLHVFQREDFLRAVHVHHERTLADSFDRALLDPEHGRFAGALLDLLQELSPQLLDRLEVLLHREEALCKGRVLRQGRLLVNHLLGGPVVVLAQYRIERGFDVGVGLNLPHDLGGPLERLHLGDLLPGLRAHPADAVILHLGQERECAVVFLGREQAVYLLSVSLEAVLRVVLYLVPEFS